MFNPDETIFFEIPAIIEKAYVESVTESEFKEAIAKQSLTVAAQFRSMVHSMLLMKGWKFKGDKTQENE